MLRYLEGVSPTYLYTYNRQADLDPVCRTKGDSEPAPPLSSIVGKTWRVLTWEDTNGQERIFRSPAFLRGDSSMLLKGKK